MVTKTYTSADLVSILQQMIDYVENTDKKQNSLYLHHSLTVHMPTANRKQKKATK